MDFSTSITFIVVLCGWSSLLIWLKHTKMNFFLFLVGSLGCFTIGMLFFLDPLEGTLNFVITELLEQIGKITHWFNVYPDYSILSIQAKNGIVSMMINYECSGIIEMLIYLSLVSFFPFMNGYRKLFAGIGGAVFIICSNIIRILSIVLVVNLFGVHSYDVAHTIIARIIFFVLMVILYYYVFTKVQIKKQKVGDIR